MPLFAATQYIDRPRTDALRSACELRLLLLPDRMYYAVVRHDHHILSCKGIVNIEGFAQEVFLRYVFEREMPLRESYVRTVAFHTSSPFSLLPEAYNRVADRLQYARALLDDTLLHAELGCTYVQEASAYALFVLRPHIASLLDEYFPNVHHSHLSRLSVRLGRHIADTEPTHLLLHILPDSLYIVAMQNRKLRLANRYPCRAAADVVYYTQAVRHATGLSDTCPIFVVGEFEQQQQLFADIRSYLHALQIPANIATFVDDVSPPFWKYAFLAV